MILPSLLPFLPPTLQTFIAHFVVFSIPLLSSWTSRVLLCLTSHFSFLRSLLVSPSVTFSRVPLYFASLPLILYLFHMYLYFDLIELFQRFVHLFLNFTSARSRFLSHSVILTTSFHNWPQALPRFSFISCSVGIAKPPFHKYAIKGTLWSFATLELTSFLQMGFCCVCILKRKRYVYLCYSHPAAALTQF